MRGRPLALKVALAAALALLPVAGSPQGASGQGAVGGASPTRAIPDLQAASAILIDARDGAVILQSGPDRRRAIASTTKLMTALLVLERAKPDAVYTAPVYRALAVESKIDLKPGERMRVDDLLEALLLESANDAAVTIAEGVSGSRAAFVRAMNERAKRIGLAGTSYANPVGLDDSANYSTARDLARLARLLLGNARFAKIVDSPSAVLESGARPRVVDNRNDLIAQYPFVDGVKTGYTRNAGYVLVGAARGPLKQQVISVVLGEPSEAARDADTLALLRYGLGRFRRVKALDSGRALATADVAHRDERVELVPARDLRVVARRGVRVVRRVDAPDELAGELPAGARVGRVTVVRGKRTVARVPLVTAAEVPGAGALRIVVADLGLPLTLLLLAVIVSVGVLAAGRLQSRRRARDRAQERRARARAEASAERPDPTT
ncbi:MAG: D-alanyl-D-alanine carboxypeptidase family protein [Thermoleophilaceae bacterium]